MKVIPRTVITDAMLVSSSVPENDYAVYAAGTTYAIGARVIRTTTHRIYESIAASNLGNTPETTLGVKWIDIAPTNRWACFDGVVGTATSAASPLSMVIAPGQVNSLTLLELVGTSCTIEMTSASEGGAVVYSKSVGLDATVILDYDEYFFEPFEQRTALVLMDLPLYSDGVITVTLTGPGTAEIGVFHVGTSIDIGDAQYGAKVGIESYSEKTRDAYGNLLVLKRENSQQPAFTLSMTKAQFNRVYRKMRALDSVLCMWIGVDDEAYSEGFWSLGFYKSFQIEVSYPTYCVSSLEIESVI